MLAGFNSVTYELGARVLYDEVTWHIFPGERIGLIGYNGTGKSTLLKLLTNKIQPNKGTVEKSKETTIGYLHQDLMSETLDMPIVDVALTAFEKAMAVQKQITALEANPNLSTNEDLLHEYTHLIADLDALGGFNLEHKAEEVLAGLGFEQKDMKRLYSTFSGGWRMRVLLAKMILQNPDLLLLDEPTNHLDLPSIEWLEKYLQSYAGAVVVVSHDKYFLDRLCTKIVEIYQKKLHFYTGNYTYYQQEKELRSEIAQKAYENQQDFIRQQERFIERFKAKASKATQAQSLVKKLDRLERLEEVVVERPNLRINFIIDKQPGKVIAELKDVSKSYGDIKIVENTDALIERGDKIGLVGANGKGKSTLLRIIANMEKFSGTHEGWYNVNEAFYAQHQIEALDGRNSVIQELQLAGSQKTELELRTLLGCFLFSGDDADKKISVLSGGEKARVALAKVIVSKANFLLLDEPTNHLDLPSVELLIEALNKYEGSYIIVSHDRYFISRTANKIWEIKNHKIKEFKGSYNEWQDWEKHLAETKNPVQSNVNKNTTTAAPKPAAKPKLNAEEEKKLQQLQRKLMNAEKDVEKFSKEVESLQLNMADPAVFNNKKEFENLSFKLGQTEKKLQQANTIFETIFEEVSALEK
jgi:ATP-binding cassette, subfamily F, member 3